jgi:hypothetical protein
MTVGNQAISHEFTIAEIAFRGVPVATPVFNELDYHGSLLGLQRLPEERNASYKQRLLDVYVHRANSSYTGLVNGITRELGLQFFTPIQITVATGVNPSWSPRIEFVDNLVYIWKDSFTQELDIVIDRGDPKLPSYFIIGLVAAINTSSVFDAIVLDSQWNYKRSDSIVNQSSSKLVEAQPLLPSLTNHLGVKFIDKGSVIFSDIDTFRTEVNSVGLVNSFGKYHINYQTGLITSFNFPLDGSIIQHSFRQEIFQPIASPVIIRAIHSAEFQKVMFHQNEQIDGTFTNGTPTDKGASIINELLSVVPMYWGP